jgi:hypothetical protein
VLDINALPTYVTQLQRLLVEHHALILADVGSIASRAI